MAKRNTGFIFTGEAVYEQMKAVTALKAINSLRPDEPPLSDITPDEQKWLIKAFRHLKAIDEQRPKGRPDDGPYCIFEFPGNLYVQYLARYNSKVLVCESVCAKFSTEAAEILTPDKEKILFSFGFESVGVSVNYSQRFDVESDDDLGYAARLAFRVLKQAYQVTNFGSGTFKLLIPKVTKVPPPELPGIQPAPDEATRAQSYDEIFKSWLKVSPPK